MWRPYAAAAAALAGAAGRLHAADRPAPHHLRHPPMARHGSSVIESINPTTFAKSRKSDAEAPPMCARRWSRTAPPCANSSPGWMTLADPQRAPLTEVEIDHRITAARARRPGFVSPSFATIAGFAARRDHALPRHRSPPLGHRRRRPAADRFRRPVLGGTTDITRVVGVGRITAEHKRDFTLVLKGVIALSSARFPRGTKSPMLDAIARAPLWAEGLDFGHGTGHGVGYFLNVHEGPQSISQSAMPEPHTAMEPGMITSIEPGLYRPGKWGIRIENLVLNRPAGETEFGEFLQFRNADVVPDRHALHRTVAAARRREALAQRLPRHGAQAPAAAVVGRRAGVAGKPYGGAVSGRATRATSAVDRLKVRSGNPKYSMSRTGSGHFFLTETPAGRRCAHRWSWTISSPSSRPSRRRRHGARASSMSRLKKQLVKKPPKTP
jgi:hypothetical protein